MAPCVDFSIFSLGLHSHQVVIDVGINRVEDSSRKRGYRLAGDVHFQKAKERASLITPVPGGPEACLLKISDLPWIYHGFTMDLPGIYHGFTMDLPWIHLKCMMARTSRDHLG